MRGETVCVTGASGFIGSWLVKRLLEQGYTVKATVRDPGNKIKVKRLLELPRAKTHLTIWNGEMTEEGIFDDPIQGCSGVFHVATPFHVPSEMDHHNEIIKPTINGVMNIMKSCLKAKTVKKFIYTSTMAAAAIHPPPQPAEYDEICWTDVDFCYQQKMDGWSYFIAKTTAEKAASEFAGENGLQFISILPSLVFGPFLTPSIPYSNEFATALITGNKGLYKYMTTIRAVHLDDVCNAHIFLFEHPQANGRYLCSNHTCTVLDLSKSLSQKYPHLNIPNKFEGVDGSEKAVPCSIKKLLDLGFTFKYGSEKYDVGDLCAEVTEFCKEKGLLAVPQC